MPFVEPTPAPAIRENAERHLAKPAQPRERVSRGHAFAQTKAVHTELPTIDLSNRKTMALRAARARDEAIASMRLVVTVDPRVTVEQRMFYMDVVRDAIGRYERQLNLLKDDNASAKVAELRKEVAELQGILYALRDEDRLLTNNDVREILAPPNESPPTLAHAAPRWPKPGRIDI